LPEGKKALSSRWVFRKKADKFKARLVVRGCQQKFGIDYKETYALAYAPVAHPVTLRILLSVINRYNLFAEQLDVKNAFLH